MNATPIRASEVSLSNPDMRTRVLESGAGIPLVLLHGNPDNADEWRNLMHVLAGRYRCVAPDLPGYGESPEPPASFGYTVPEQIAFLDAVLRATAVSEPLILVVHDIGGMLGVPWAAANLERLRGMVITNTVAFEGFEWFGIVRRWGDTSPLGRLRARLLMGALGLGGGRLFKRAFGRQCPELGEAELERFARSFACNRAAKNASLRQFRVVLEREFFAGFDEHNRRISASVPTRVLWGERDPFVPAARARSFGTAQVRMLPEHGHWVPILAARELAAEIDALRESPVALG